VRLGEPVLSDGSHRSYAIQWFSFALIALVGGTLLVREELVRRRVPA
jgi:cytochrome oxidase assembly protein ShyY1